MLILLFHNRIFVIEIEKSALTGISGKKTAHLVLVKGETAFVLTGFFVKIVINAAFTTAALFFCCFFHCFHLKEVQDG